MDEKQILLDKIESAKETLIEILDHYRTLMPEGKSYENEINEFLDELNELERIKKEIENS